MIFCTRGCSLKFSGTVVMRSPSACSVSIGRRVSSCSFHLRAVVLASSRPRTAACSWTGSSCWCGSRRRAPCGRSRPSSSPSLSRDHAFAAPAGPRRACACVGSFAMRLVHERLRDHRLVLLVVPEAAVAHQVDDHVLVELHAVVERDLGGEAHRFRIVAVHVEDRHFQHLRDVGAVERRARVAQVGAW